jgi:hypothetical protein
MDAPSIAAGLMNLDRPVEISAIHGPCCKAAPEPSSRKTKAPGFDPRGMGFLD